MGEVSDAQVYILVIITDIENLRGFRAVVVLSLSLFFFCFVFVQKSLTFLPNRYIFNEKKRYINVYFSVFFFNYFNPKHLPENNISLNMLWNKVDCDELGCWCFDVATGVPAIQTPAASASSSETQRLCPPPPPHPRPTGLGDSCAC